MNVAEQDYRIWKNENFVIESSINLSLWDEILINHFHEKLNRVLNEIYQRIDLFSLFASLIIVSIEKIISPKNSVLLNL